MNYFDQLNKQIEFIENSSALFDLGKLNESIRIGVSLRVLLHDTKNSTSLLTLMQKKVSVKLLSTCDGPYDIERRMGFSLTGLNFIGNPTKVQVVSNLHRHNSSKELSAEDWWNEAVFCMPQTGALSRKDFALMAANKDGGAHVSKLPQSLQNIKDGLAGIKIHTGEGLQTDFKEIWPYTLRQMAWELVNSIDLIILKHEA